MEILLKHIKQFEEILLNNISDDLHKKVFFWAVSEKGEGGGTYQNFWYLMYLWSNSSEKLYKLPKFSEGRSSLAIKKMTEPFFFSLSLGLESLAAQTLSWKYY